MKVKNCYWLWHRTCHTREFDQARANHTADSGLNRPMTLPASEEPNTRLAEPGRLTTFDRTTASVIAFPTDMSRCCDGNKKTRSRV